MPKVGYAFEYFHCYNEIQTVLTTVSAQCEDQTGELRATREFCSLWLTSVTDESFFERGARQHSECSGYIQVCFSCCQLAGKKIARQRRQDLLPWTHVQREKRETSAAINIVSQQPGGRWQKWVLIQSTTFCVEVTVAASVLKLHVKSGEQQIASIHSWLKWPRMTSMYNLKLKRWAWQRSLQNMILF